MGGSHSQPWRTMPENNEECLDFVKSYQPHNKEVKHLRVLLYGPVGAGKSNFINSVESVLQGRVTVRALTDAISATTFTRKYTTYKIRKGQEGFHSIIFNDIMGFEENTEKGVHVEDVKLALMGQVTEGYKFRHGQQLKAGEQGYNSSPTLDDRVHVLVCVVPASSVSLLSEKVVKKMREVRLAASEMGIPQVAILTKVDEACPEVKKDIKKIYESYYLKEQVEKFSLLLGISQNCIFLVKNYSSEIVLNDDINAPILMALRQFINYAEDFLNNM